MATHFFVHHDSPSNLAESRYPRPHSVDRANVKQVVFLVEIHTDSVADSPVSINYDYTDAILALQFPLISFYYGVATISKLLKITRLFCRILSLL